jgi:uncharacterized protein DUF6766
MKKFKQLLFDNGLVLLMFGMFAVFLVGLIITGYQYNNEELASHKQPAEALGQYVVSGEFVEAVFENWESEFLQMATLVIATIFLRQKGAPDSKKLRGKSEVDTTSRYSIIHASSWPNRTKAMGEALYANSLSIALLVLFVISFVLHAAGGTVARNDEAQFHHEPEISTMQYVASSQFWFESFQNWQSEFLSVGALLLFSVYLRQRGSPQSKAVGSSNQKTGN